MAPWSTYLALPLFAFSSTGVSLDADFSAPHALSIFTGVILGLVAGKPIGIAIFSYAARKTGIGRSPDGVSFKTFLGASLLCGIGDPLAFLLADQAFPDSGDASMAKIAVLVGSVMAAGFGTGIIALAPSRAAR